MIYSADTPKHILIPILLMLSLLSNFNKVVQILIILAFGIVMLLQFHLTVQTSHLEYKMTIYKFTIYRIILNSEKIKKIKFGRIGWTTKNAVLKVKGSFNFGVAYFNNEKLVQELEQFAYSNSIEIQKTKDYILLEKYYSHN